MTSEETTKLKALASRITALLKTVFWRLLGYREPAPRLCEWCQAPLPADAGPGQKYCGKVHRRKAREHRNGHPVRDARRAAEALDAAWTLNGTYESHAASCTTKTANGGAYGSFSDALRALSWLRTDAQYSRDKGSVYRCLVCKKFHITSHAYKTGTPHE